MPALDLSLLDPGVRAFVGFLRAKGFETTDSGDGAAKLGGPMDDGFEVLPFPHVFIRVHEATELLSEADRLLRVLAEAGIEVLPGTIDATYDPADRVALIALIDDADQYMKAFTWRS